jgi:hypothetical protein
VDRSAGARDCADPPGIQGHGGGGGAWAAARRGRAHGRRRRGGAGFADVGPGLQAITQHGLQAFLWHELARKWLTDREASCTSPLRWGGCWSRSGCPATPRSAVGPDRRGAGEAAHDLVAALLWSLAAELQGSGLLSRRGRHGLVAYLQAATAERLGSDRWMPIVTLAGPPGRRTARPRPRGVGRRQPPPAFSRTAWPGDTCSSPASHHPAVTPRSPVGRPGRRCRGTLAIPAQLVVS